MHLDFAEFLIKKNFLLDGKEDDVSSKDFAGQFPISSTNGHMKTKTENIDSSDKDTLLFPESTISGKDEQIIYSFKSKYVSIKL